MSNVIDRDFGWNKIVQDLKLLDGKSVSAGILKNAGKEPNGAKLVDVAFWNEYGTKKIPSRPFVRLSFENNKDKWGDLAEEVVADVIDKRGYTQGLKKLGNEMKTDIISIFGDTTQLAHNAPRTIAKKKGRDEPLVDEGKLKASVNFRID